VPFVSERSCQSVLEVDHELRNGGTRNGFSFWSAWFGLFECLASEPASDMGTDAPEANRRDALACELVRPLIHGVAGMATCKRNAAHDRARQVAWIRTRAAGLQVAPDGFACPHMGSTWPCRQRMNERADKLAREGSRRFARAHRALSDAGSEAKALKSPNQAEPGRKAILSAPVSEFRDPPQHTLTRTRNKGH